MSAKRLSAFGALALGLTLLEPTIFLGFVAGLLLRAAPSALGTPLSRTTDARGCSSPSQRPLCGYVQPAERRILGMSGRPGMRSVAVHQSLVRVHRTSNDELRPGGGGDHASP
jgi:hypothetical protein